MVRNLINRTTSTPSTRQVQFTPSAPLSRVLDQFFNDDPFFAFAPIAFSREQASSMALDFGEDESNYILKASLPGFGPHEVTCEVNDGVLTIKGEKTQEQEDSNQTWHRRERRVGTVVRQVQLPGPVIEDQANAELVDGVLTLRLPKVQKAAARRIVVNGTANGSGHADPALSSSGTSEARTNRMSGIAR